MANGDITNVEELKKKLEEKTERLGHSLGEWKWSHEYWRAWCENRNCYAHMWIKPDNPGEPYGGNATSAECWLASHGFDGIKRP